MGDFVKEDLVYYERSIKEFYRKIFMRKMIFCGVIALVVAGAAFFLDIAFSVVGILIIIGLIAIIFNQLKKMKLSEEIFQQEMEKWTRVFQVEEPENIEQILESDTHYFIEYTNQDLTVSVRKRDSRNLPSRKRGYSILIGENANKLDTKNEFVLVYYDIGKVKHAAAYKEKLVKATNFVAKKQQRMLIKSVLIVIGLLAAWFVIKTMYEDQRMDFGIHQEQTVKQDISYDEVSAKRG